MKISRLVRLAGATLALVFVAGCKGGVTPAAVLIESRRNTP